jgi:hypothetical protein
MKYEKVILITPENAEEQAHFEAEYPHLQFYCFRTIKTFVVPVEDDPVHDETVGGASLPNYHVAVNVIKDYYGIQVPDSIMLATIDKHPELKASIMSGRIGTPDQREKLVNALLRELGQPSWPAADTNSREFQNFTINLSMKLAQVGGKLKYQRA